MAGQIRVVPDTLRAAAQQHFALSDKMQEVNKTLENAATVLDHAWDGLASKYTLNTLRQLCRNSLDAANWLDGCGKQIGELADAYEAIDARRSHAFSPAISFAFTTITLATIVGIPFDGTLRVQINELTEGARICARGASLTDEAEKELRRVMSMLQDNWDGVSARNIYQEGNKLSERMSQLRDGLQMLSEKLQMVAKRYEETERSL